MERLKNKIALVTGGSRGIGRAIALAFASEGAKVAIAYRADESAAQKTLSDLHEVGKTHLAIKCDVTSYTETENVAHQVIETFGRVDILANNAGVLSRKPFLELEPEEFQRIHSVNIQGAFNTSYAIAQQMRKQSAGVILNIASVAAKRPYWNLAHYCTSKAALSMLTQSMALELAQFGIRVNEICPGLIETDLNREDLKDPAFRKSRVDKIPLERVGLPQDLTEAAIYLCSDRSEWVTGASIVIDGGALTAP